MGATRAISAIRWSLALLALAGCAGPPPAPSPAVAHPERYVQYVQTTGSYRWPDKPLKGTVWVKGSTGPGADEALLVARGALIMMGFDVVERDQLPLLLKEQETQLRYGDDRRADQVSVGKLTGAQLVAFVETESRPSKGYYADGYEVSVSVRVVSVETGEVFFLGKARWTKPVPSPTYGIDELATRAVSRAVCPSDAWDEASDANGWTGRCQP